MPKYISITPQFNPISLDEYLRVPTLVYTEQQKELDKIEDYKDKLSYYKALMGDSDEAKEIFSGYNDIMNQMTENVGSHTVAELQRLGKKARSSFRDITSRIDIASQKRAEQQKRKDKDPSNVGDVGSLMDYYNNPDYTPTFISGKDLSTRIGTISQQLAQSLPYNMEGYVDPAKSKMRMSQGYTPDELNAAYLEATNYGAVPTTALGKALRRELDAIGYSSLNPAMQRELAQSINTGLQSGARQYSVMANPNYMSPAQALSYQTAKEARADAKAQRERDRISGMKGAQEIVGQDGQTYYYTYNGQVIRIVNSKGEPVVSFTDSYGTQYPYSGTPGIFKAVKEDNTATVSTKKPVTSDKTISGKSVFDAGFLASDNFSTLKNDDINAAIDDAIQGISQVVTYSDLSDRQREALVNAYPNLKYSDKQNDYVIIQKDRKNFTVIYDPNGTVRASLGLDSTETTEVNPYMTGDITSTEL